MSSDQLFEMSEPAADPTEGMSAQRKLTHRQAARLAQGLHPLSITNGHIGLHPDAAPAATRTTDGLRCRTCTHLVHEGPHSYIKCGFGNGVRISHGPATDVRLYWPACVDYEAADRG
jgi:hypothetical protein